MTTEIALALTIIVAALALFATEKLRLDLVALLVLLSLGSLHRAGRAVQDGVADAMGQGIFRLVEDKELRHIVTTMATCSVISALVNNVGTTAMLMPALIGISRRTKIAVYTLLMRLSFSSLLGGKMTLIGTPANILTTGILADFGLSTPGFLESTSVGLVVPTTGIFYMVLIGRHVSSLMAELEDEYNVMEVSLDCPDVARRPLCDLEFPRQVMIILVRRDGDVIYPRGDTRLGRGDRLTSLGPLDGVQEMAHRCNGRQLPENVSEEKG